MNILALDTATEQCSVALIAKDAIYSRATLTARNHADLILPMIDEVLAEAGVTLAMLNAIAFGRGPGSFTGVRIGTGVAQGLGLATSLPVIGVSNLAAVAQRQRVERNLTAGQRILVCMDARMQEVYWGVFVATSSGDVELIGDERVDAASAVVADAIQVGAGTGWHAYPILTQRFAGLAIDDTALPRATEIAQLARHVFVKSGGVAARDAQPVYLRDDVVRAPS